MNNLLPLYLCYGLSLYPVETLLEAQCKIKFVYSLDERKQTMSSVTQNVSSSFHIVLELESKMIDLFLSLHPFRFGTLKMLCDRLRAWNQNKTYSNSNQFRNMRTFSASKLKARKSTRNDLHSMHFPIILSS